jgi:hypothetical protein
VGTIGLPQVNSGNISGLPLVTAGNEIANVSQFLQPGRDSYTAAEVILLLLGKVGKIVTASPEMLTQS